MPAVKTVHLVLAGIGAFMAALLASRFASKEDEGTPAWGGAPAEPLPDIPFVQAKHFGTGRPAGPINLIIIHTAESPQSSTAAKSVAGYFATTDTVASAHYIVDDNSIYQSVREADQAWHAAGDNAHSIGIEHAGYAKQSPEEWQSEYNQKMLALSARLAADIAGRYGIPAVKLTIADLLAGKSGFASHADVSKAFKKSDHTDPGINFPWDSYLAAVQSQLPIT